MNTVNFFKNAYLSSECHKYFIDLFYNKEFARNTSEWEWNEISRYNWRNFNWKHKEITGIEVVEDETLDFQEQFKHHEPESIEDSELDWDSISSDEADDSHCTKNKDKLLFDYKKKAVEYWRSGKTKNLNIRTVTHRSRKVISKT